MELLELIQTLASAHGPSGNEGGIREPSERWPPPMGGGPPPTLWAISPSTSRDPDPKGDAVRPTWTPSASSSPTLKRRGSSGWASWEASPPQEILYTPVRFQNGVRGVVVKEEKASFSKLKLDECYVGCRGQRQGPGPGDGSRSATPPSTTPPHFPAEGN